MLPPRRGPPYYSLTHSLTVSLTCAKFNSWGPFRGGERSQLGADDGVPVGGCSGEVAEYLHGGAEGRGLDFLAHTWSHTEMSLMHCTRRRTAHPKESTFLLSRRQSSLNYIFLFYIYTHRHGWRGPQGPRQPPRRRLGRHPATAMQRCRCRRTAACRSAACRCRNCRTRKHERTPEPDPEAAGRPAARTPDPLPSASATTGHHCQPGSPFPSAAEWTNSQPGRLPPHSLMCLMSE